MEAKPQGRARFTGKVVIVTGGGQGIGKATAELFVGEGAKVAIFDYNDKNGTETAAALNNTTSDSAMFVKVNVAKESEVEAAVLEVVKQFGRLDILVNNAAAFVFGTVEQATEEDWDRVLAVNVKGMAFCSKYAVKQMKAQEGGKGAIVNLASMSSYVAQPNFVPYSTTKAAILGLTRNMALDFAPHIRVNAVAPGCIDTEATRNACSAKGFPLEKLYEVEGAKHMLGRVGQPIEIAYPILFLASDEASFITGTTLMVDGGNTAMA